MLIPTRGLLITIEGIDGSGKSTQVEVLVNHLRKCGLDVVQLREPTNGPWGKKIKKLAKKGRTVSPKEEFELFLKDRKDDVKKNIIPALKKGKIVVMDRYYYSTMAYQGALGLKVEDIRKTNEKFAPVPDLVIIIDMDPEIGLSRIENKRKEGPDHFESFEYQEKVSENFQKMTDYNNVVIVDGGMSIKDVHHEIKRIVGNLIDSKFE
jgi:dTMP kinase